MNESNCLMCNAWCEYCIDETGWWRECSQCVFAFPKHPLTPPPSHKGTDDPALDQNAFNSNVVRNDSEVDQSPAVAELSPFGLPLDLEEAILNRATPSTERDAPAWQYDISTARFVYQWCQKMRKGDRG